MVSPYGVNLSCGINMDEKKVKYVCNTLNPVIDNNAKNVWLNRGYRLEWIIK